MNVYMLQTMQERLQMITVEPTTGMQLHKKSSWNLKTGASVPPSGHNRYVQGWNF